MGLAVREDNHCMYCGELCTNTDEYVTIKRVRYKAKRWFHKGCYTKEERIKCSYSKPEQ